jgi:hypothetical protein
MESTERRLSTNNRGPRSPAGKAAVSLNHLKHGLAAAAIVLPSEDAAEWETFHEDVLVRFDAEGPVEIALASRVAELLWRLRRVARAEEQSVSVGQMHRDVLALDGQQPGSMSSPAAPDTGLEGHNAQAGADARQQPAQPATRLSFYAGALAAISATSRYRETLPVLLPDDATLEKIMRYEAHLSRLLKHALHELEALQDRRRGNTTPLARIDID